MKKHYAWIVMISCFLLQAATTGIYLNCSALYIPQIIKEMDFSMGAFSSTITIRTLANAIGVYICANIFNQKNFRIIFLVCGFICSSCFTVQIFFTKLWQWQLSNAVLGLALGFILTVPLVLMIQNWFKDRQGLALGLAMTGSGIAGMIFNPMSSYLIAGFGWRTGVVVLSLISLALIVPIICFIAKWDPSEIGCERYTDGSSTTSVSSGDRNYNELISAGILLTIIFYLLSQYNQSISMYLDSLGMSVMFAGLISSVMMAGNVGGKLLIGYLVDRLGTAKVFTGTVFGIMFSFAVFAFMPKELLLIPSSFFYGLSMSLASLGPGLISKELLSGERKKVMMGRMTSYCNIANAVYIWVISYSFDFFGSYVPIFTLAIPLCMISIYLLARIDRMISR